MNAKRRHFQQIVTLLVFLLATGMPAAGRAENRLAATIVGGVINTDTTWTLAGSPYDATSIVTVLSNVTLTIEPGVEVRFAPNTRLSVNGTLHAVGSDGHEIIFTGSDPTPGSWQGIWVAGVSGIRSLANRLEHVIVEYGGAGIANPANLYTSNADVILRHATLQHGGGNGFTAWNEVTAELSNVQFIDNPGYAARFLAQAQDPLLAHLTASGNGNDAVGVGGAGTPIDTFHRWEVMGLPYIANGITTVGLDARLLVEPGVEVQFADRARLDVQGQLSAKGTPELPVIFSAVNKVPGAWDGIVFSGSRLKAALGDFSYATVEYAGAGFYAANITVNSARVTLDHSSIRNSAVDGLHLGSFSSRSSILASQITGNNGYGILNTDNDPAATDVVASNNWWGHNSGPRSDSTCNPGAQGDRVSAGVVFQPFLSDSAVDPGPVPALGAYTFSITPHRWYAPADGTPLYIDITVYDGEGHPVPNRQVTLSTTLGAVEIGPLTDPQGHVIAVLRSDAPGEAELVASLADMDACESALDQSVRITLTPGVDPADELGNSLAPYVDTALTVEPEPLMAGVPATIRYEVTNPYDFDISIDATFGIAQSGIGLVFGPAGEVYDFFIPAHATRTMEVLWTPPISGHYCFEVEGSIYRVTARISSLNGREYHKPMPPTRKNFNYGPAPLAPKWQVDLLVNSAAIINQIGDANFVFTLLTSPKEVIGGFIPEQGISNIINFINSAGGGIICGLSGGTNCSGYHGPKLDLPFSSYLSKDPPRQDYMLLAVPETFTYPTLVAGPDLPAARAAALNTLMQTSFDLMSVQAAAIVTYDRYAGATEAKDLTWASIQANAYSDYLKQTGGAMVLFARAINDLITEVKAEGFTDLIVTAQDWTAYQDRLSTEGWNEVERQAAATAGMDSEGLELLRQKYLATDPAEAAGSVMDRLQARADQYETMGWTILRSFTTGFGVGGSAGRQVAAAAAPTGNNLARIFEYRETIQVGNPLDHTATIELQIRPLGIPSDWVITLSEDRLTLEPNTQAPVTITIRPGLPVVQGTRPAFAVEGFVDDELISGVVLEVAVPVWVNYNQPYPVYLPVLAR